MTMSPRRQDLPDLPPLIHQALLNPLLQEEELHNLCDASRQLGFGGVCVSLSHLEAVRQRLGEPDRCNWPPRWDSPSGTTGRTETSGGGVGRRPWR